MIRCVFQNLQISFISFWDSERKKTANIMHCSKLIRVTVALIEFLKCTGELQDRVYALIESCRDMRSFLNQRLEAAKAENDLRKVESADLVTRVRRNEREIEWNETEIADNGSDRQEQLLGDQSATTRDRPQQEAGMSIHVFIVRILFFIN